MKMYEYPKEVTEENIKELTEKAENIRKRSRKQRYGFFIGFFYGIIGFTIIQELDSLLNWLALNGYLNFLLWFPLETLPITFLVFKTLVNLVVIFPVLAILILLLNRVSMKYLGFPTYEEIIFAESFVIAKNVSEDKRLLAKKEVGGFLRGLTLYCRDFLNNPKRRIYSPEFNLLRCGKNQINRMLMFSDRASVSNVFRNFGLTFVKNDDPKAFLNLEEIIKSIKVYGEPKGRVNRFLGGIERYPNSLPWIVSTILLIIALIYFLISGQRLPVG